MPISPRTDPNFAFKAVEKPAAEPVLDLGPLAQLVGPTGKGKWEGIGFNTIWRPHPLAEGHDRFLELNLTSEKLEFTAIPGKIPNRGLLMPDINMFGITYMQQIEGTDPVEGLHIEPGIWAHVPPTTDPEVPSTVVRMASIPHGTTILAQGTFLTVQGGPQIAEKNIIPFEPGKNVPTFAEAEAIFTELNLGVESDFRQASAGVTEAMVENPNSVLVRAIQGQDIKSTTVLIVSTKHLPVPGGGTSNTAFLEAATNPPGGNATAVEVDAIFWIETVADPNGGPDILQLQYTQTVQLVFNKLTWPHITVATLKQV
ncbi:MAG: heme-binding protein [Solirubrobacteraceae bacterium]